MRRLLLFGLFALFFSPVFALTISTDRQLYSPAEEGLVVIDMDVPRDLERIILELEVLDENGVMVYADIMYTQIPMEEGIQTFEVTQSHISWSEIPVDNKITRLVPFIIPVTASSGNYSVVVRALYHDYVVDSDITDIEIVGGLPIIDFAVIVLIFVLLIAVIIWKEV